MPLPIWWSLSFKAMSKSSRSRTQSNPDHRESQISFDDGCEGYQTTSLRHGRTGLIHISSSSSINTLATFDNNNEKVNTLPSHSFLSHNNRIKNEQDFGHQFDSVSSAKPSSPSVSSEGRKKPFKLKSPLKGGSLKPFGSKPAMVILDDHLGYESSSSLRAQQKKKKSRSTLRRRTGEPTVVSPILTVPKIHCPYDHCDPTLISSYRARENSTSSWATTLDGSRTLSSVDFDSHYNHTGPQSSRFALNDGYSVNEWGSSSISSVAEQSTSQHSLPLLHLRSPSLPQMPVHTTRTLLSNIPFAPSPPAPSSLLPYREEHPVGPVRSHDLPAQDLSSLFLPISSTGSRSTCTHPVHPSPYLCQSSQTPGFQPRDCHPPRPLINSSPLSPKTSKTLISPTPTTRRGRRKSLKILTTLFSSGPKAEPVSEMAGRTMSTTDKRKSRERHNSVERAILSSPRRERGNLGHYHLNSPKGPFFRKKRTTSVETRQEEERREEVKNGKDKEEESLVLEREGDEELRQSCDSDIEAVTAQLLPLFTLPPQTSIVLEQPPAVLHPCRPPSRGSSASEPMSATATATIAASTSAKLGLSYSLPVRSELQSTSINRHTSIDSPKPLSTNLPLSPPSRETPTSLSPDQIQDPPNWALCPSAPELTSIPTSPTPTIVPDTCLKKDRPLPSISSPSLPRKRDGSERKTKLSQLGRSSSEASNVTDLSRSSFESEGESLVLLYLSSSTLND